jgi:hypothetical protein
MTFSDYSRPDTSGAAHYVGGSESASDVESVPDDLLTTEAEAIGSAHSRMGSRVASLLSPDVATDDIAE